jgi:hypothetical protein
MPELELTDFQKEIAALVLDTPAPGKHSARSAIRSLERAWAILALDPEMAFFRGITAEEEAATALFHSLQRHRYPGSQRIKWQNHDYKAAVIPFFTAVSYIFADITQFESGLQIDSEDGPRRVKTWLKLRFPDGQERKLMPIPPLHYEFTAEDRRHDFVPEIGRVASDRNVESIRQFVKQRANERNEVLYASSQGIPNVSGNLEAHLRRRQTDVFALLTAYLLIDPYREHQLFAVQALDAFLGMMDQVREREARIAEQQPNER